MNDPQPDPPNFDADDLMSPDPWWPSIDALNDAEAREYVRERVRRAAVVGCYRGTGYDDPIQDVNTIARPCRAYPEHCHHEACFDRADTAAQICPLCDEPLGYDTPIRGIYPELDGTEDPIPHHDGQCPRPYAPPVPFAQAVEEAHAEIAGRVGPMAGRCSRCHRNATATLHECGDLLTECCAAPFVEDGE